MRYDTLIYFQTVIAGAYDPETGDYCLVLSAAGGTTKSSITLSRGSLKLVGQSLLSLDTQELAVNANSIQFTVAEGSYCPYYKAGDTVTIERMYCAGGVTGSGTNLYFYIPLAKPLIGVSNVTILWVLRRACHTRAG